MEAVALSRVTLGLTLLVHFLLAPMAMGLALVVAVAEALRWRTGADVYRRAADFWLGVFAVTFAAQVVTAGVLALVVATSWGGLVRFVGLVLGGPLIGGTLVALGAVAALLALLLRRERLAPGARCVAATALWLAASLSVFFLVSASSFTQTPAGFVVTDGRAVPAPSGAALLSPSALPRFAHTLTSSWAMAAFLVAGAGAWWSLRGRRSDVARLALRLGTVGVLVSSVLVFLSGDRHARQVAHTQPAKFAAMQGLRTTATGAPLILFSLPPTEGGVASGPEVTVTRLTSFLAFGNFQAPVKGLDEFPRADWPPVAATFLSFHNMVILGNLMLLEGLIGIGLLLKGRLEWTRWWLVALVVSIPVPALAVALGWLSAEAGRQPWAVYGLLRAGDGVSPGLSPAAAVATFVAVALTELAVTALWLAGIVARLRKGPELAAGSPHGVPRPLPDELLHA